MAEEQVDGRTPIEIPATLRDSLQARLDRLGPAKEIAQIGAAIGRSFDFSLLSQVAGVQTGELTQMLGQLVGSGLMTNRGQPPDAVYTFKHALVQDTAYATLLRSRRTKLHAEIGEAIETSFAETGETEPEVLAHHFAEAGELKKAAEYLLKSGRFAIRRSSFQEAIAQLNEGLNLVAKLPVGPERLALECDLSATLAPAIRAVKGMAHPDAEQAYERAHELCLQIPDSPHSFPMMWGRWHIRWCAGDMRNAVDYAEELLASAEKSQRSDHLLVAHCSLAIALFHNGENEEVLPHIEEARKLYDPAEHAGLGQTYWYEFGIFSYVLLSLARFSLGEPDTALLENDKAQQLAQDLKQPHNLMFAMTTKIQNHSFRREFKEALASFEAVLTTMGPEPSRNPFFHILACFAGWAKAMSGNPREGVEMLRRAYHDWQESGAQYFVPLFAAMLADACVANDDPEVALKSTDEALSVLDRTAQEQWRSWILWSRGDALLAMDQPDAAEAERCYQQAIEVARAQSAKSWGLRAALHLAWLWRSQGKDEEARDLLAPIYDSFTEGFKTPDLIEAQKLLEVNA